MSVQLISMPWMSSRMPSIQLGTIQSVLATGGVDADSHHLYVEFARSIGVTLYEHLASSGGVLEEWIFASNYFDRPPSRIPTELNPLMVSAAITGQAHLEGDFGIAFDLRNAALEFVTTHARDPRLLNADVIGFTLTISQLGSSLLMARELRRNGFDGGIIFGGSACDGESGGAIVEAFDEVDGVFQGSADQRLVDGIEEVLSGRPPSEVACFSPGQPASGPAAGSSPVTLSRRKRTEREALPVIVPDYADYFARVDDLGPEFSDLVWLPIQSSVGCSWGEKLQCSFCGLTEDMRYRAAKAADVISLFDELHARHKTPRFFAVDLIMPDLVKTDVSDELVRRGDGFELFYEIKADVTRSELATMADAGIRWIQPGIESLSDRVLSLMRKGTTAGHNLQLLRWASEFDVRVSWNLLLGQPGEADADYEPLWTLIPRLLHLQPPSGAGALQIHRFSPLFDELGGSGGGRLQPRQEYSDVFAIDQAILRRLAYVFDEGDPSAALEHRLERVQRLVTWWRQRHWAGARLQWRDDGTIDDSRYLHRRIFHPDPTMAALLHFASSFITPAKVSAELSFSEEEIGRAIERAEEVGLGLQHRGKFLSLVLPSDSPRTYEQRTGPFRYLTEADQVLA